MQRFVSPQFAEACVFPEPLRTSHLAGQRVLFSRQLAPASELAVIQLDLEIAKDTPS
jgi:hypothetical protein